MNQIKYLSTLIILLFCTPIWANEINYSVVKDPWAEWLGNHRAVLQVDSPADAVELNILWRRHDKDPHLKRFIIVHENGDTIQHIRREHVDNERCHLIFGPVDDAGKYYFYYLPYEVQEGYGFYNKGYLRREDNWEKQFNGRRLPSVKLVGFQARTDFDSFFPMEVIALQSEKEALIGAHKTDYLVFTEDRKLPIRMLDNIPQRWVGKGPTKQFEGEAFKNEYYCFQLGVYAARKDLKNLKVDFTQLVNGEFEISGSKLTCFNTGGTGPYGDTFEKRLDLKKGSVQPLWIGVDIPKNIISGKYEGQITIRAENAKPQTVDIRLIVNNETLADRGDSERWRHSRLRWLNSRLGIDDLPTKPFNAISYLGDGTYEMTGKTFTLSDSGFPGSLKVRGAEILSSPIAFVVEGKDGVEKFEGLKNIIQIKSKPGMMTGMWENTSSAFNLNSIGSIESDGYIHYKVVLTAKSDIKLNDIRLEIPVTKKIAKYTMGMGLPGTTVPKSHKSKWKGPHDSFWMGSEQAGIWCELRGGDYHGPLLNLYKPEFPESWYNDGRGGFKIEGDDSESKVVVYSGSRNLTTGEALEFEWSMLLTPVKEIDYKSQFVDRYYHNWLAPAPRDKDLEAGVKVINVHHANEYNPTINYPFVAVDEMTEFVRDMHALGQKVKIYYTIRELSNYATEIWALRSLNHEILGDGVGGGYPWLREHLVYGYRPQWYQWFPDQSADASIVNAPVDSRWYNYYIEGLKWLVENVDIDGLYLDDVTYDRRIVKRIRKVLDNTKPGCLLDLHSNTGFSKGPAIQYAEFFPYMDKLWFGESFMYDKMPPENWFVEVSGIPFGLMSDMLHRGGNRWLGMLFGMTVRHPWLTDGIICDPRPVWKIWDEFQIQEAEMIGFWNDDCPVKASLPDVKTTVYKKTGKTLLSIGNFSDSPKAVSLKIDFDALGLEATKVKLNAPFIQDFQSEKEWAVGDKITVDPRRGWLMFVESK